MQLANHQEGTHPQIALKKARVDFERILPSRVLDISEIISKDKDLILLLKDIVNTDKVPKEKSYKVIRLDPPIQDDGFSLEYWIINLELPMLPLEAFFRDKNGFWCLYSKYCKKQEPPSEKAEIISFPKKPA